MWRLSQVWCLAGGGCVRVHQEGGSPGAEPSGFGLPVAVGMKAFNCLVCAAGSSCSKFPQLSLLYGQEDYRNTTEESFVYFGVFNQR